MAKNVSSYSSIRHSIVDVVEVLTDSKDPRDYLKKMRKRDPQLDAYVGTNCPQVNCFR